MRPHPIWKENEAVIDLTALRNNWPDKEGVVIDADGSQVKIRYTPSGTERWKADINVRKKPS